MLLVWILVWLSDPSRLERKKERQKEEEEKEKEEEGKIILVRGIKQMLNEGKESWRKRR